MIGCLDCLNDVQIIIDCPVGLPNGKQAAATKKGTMMFNSKLDRTSRMVIGVGEQREGLHFFRDMVTAAAMQINGRSSFDLWHKRLGHPSFRVVEMFPNVGSSKNSTLSNKVCEVCLRAKQCRDSFPTSTDKTSVIF